MAIRIYNLLKDIIKRLNILGLGNPYENLCNTSNMLTVSARYIGGIQRVSTSDATTLSNRPPLWKSGSVVAYRQVFANYTKGSSVTHAVVILNEVYPKPGRIWINIYNTAWQGWMEHNPSGGGSYSEYGYTSFDSFTTTGVYWINTKDVSGHKPVSTTDDYYGYLEVNAVSSASILQRFTHWSDATAWERQYQNNKWYGWRQVQGFTYLVSSGSTSGWHWRKYSDGFYECWYFRLSLPIAANATVSATKTVNLPFTVKSIYTIQHSLYQNTSATANAGVVDVTGYTTSSISLHAFTNNGAALTYAVEPQVSIYVCGTY